MPGPNAALTRRQFLLAGAAAALSGCVIGPPRRGGKPDPLEFDLFRPQDGFSAKLEIYGFDVQGASRPTLVARSRDPTDQSRVLVFHFPPQHTAEIALDRTQVDRALKDGSIDAQLAVIGLLSAKTSKLVFRVPLDKKALPIKGRAMPFALENLLAWEKFEFVLPDINDPYGTHPDFASKPASQRAYLLGLGYSDDKVPNQTSAIDLPTGLFLQPAPGEIYKQSYVWKTRGGIKKVGDYIESWSAFLVRVNGDPVKFALVDIWGVSGGLAPDDGNGVGRDYYNTSKKFEYNNSSPPAAADDVDARRYDNTPVDFYDRIELAVTLSPRFVNPVIDPQKPRIIARYYGEDTLKDECGRLVPMRFSQCYVPLDHALDMSTYGISADGGFLDLDGNWSVLPECTIKGWVQRTTRRRDTFVRVVRKGYLYPFGLEAELVEETERSYLRDSQRRLVAPLIKQIYVRPVQPAIAAQVSPEECFSQIQVVTPRTPALDPELVPGDLEYKQLDAFVPHAAGKPFPFEFEGIDLTGQPVQWSMPVYFVSNRQTSNRQTPPPEEGRFPENPDAPLPRNQFANELNYVRVLEKLACDIAPSDDVAVNNFIKLIDSFWEQLPYRFADLHGAVVALASPGEKGDTSAEVKWLEWTRGLRPPPLNALERKNGRLFVERPMSPRIRTARIALQGLRQFSGAVPDMLGSYRDLRMQHQGDALVTPPWTLDPEEVQTYEQFHVGMLIPDLANRAAPFFCILPVGTAEQPQDARRSLVISTYYPRLPDSPDIHPLFDRLDNEVQFGRAKNTEGLGGLATPDGAISLLTRAYGPVGDNRQNLQSVARNLSAARTKNSTGLHRFKASASNPRVGGINLGIDSLFGKSAEILPGISFADVLEYLFEIGGDESAFAARSETRGDNLPRWSARVTGLEWLTALIEGAQAGAAPLELGDPEAGSDPIVEPGEPTRVGLEATLDWNTSAFKELDASMFRFIPSSASRGRRSEFGISARAWLDFANPEPEISASCTLSDFSIEFLEALLVDFAYVRFEIDASGNKRFDPSIANVTFSGRLEFINGLKDLLQGLEDQFGLKIDISPARVSVQQVIAYPGGEGGMIALGPAIITNLSFSWGIIIPLLGRDRMRVVLGVASREDPMCIAVGIYGGRAYAIFEADTKGPRLIEVSADYGGVFSAAWSGIAKGSVSLTAGFTFSLQWNGTKSADVDLFAFAQFTGKLSIVRIFSLCANVVVGMGYKDSAGGSIIYGLARCSCSFSMGIAKYKYRYEVYKEERANDSKEKRTPLVAARTGTSPTLDRTGSDCLEQLADAGFFYPLGEESLTKEWEEYFSATT